MVNRQVDATCEMRAASALKSSMPLRAFALEGRGIWHALSLSAQQQVYGPVRARADLRVALESPAPMLPAEEAGRATLEGAWKVCMHIIGPKVSPGLQSAFKDYAAEEAFSNASLPSMPQFQVSKAGSMYF